MHYMRNILKSVISATWSWKTEDQGNNRGKGVIDYLKDHPEIDDLKKNISEWEVYGGTGILFTKAAETLQKFFRKIETMK